MRMKKPEMEVKHFDSEDVIATSSIVPVPPVYLIVENLGNRYFLDNKITIKNGAYDGKSVNNTKDNTTALSNALVLLNSAFEVDTITEGTLLYRSDYEDSTTFHSIFGSFRFADQISPFLNATYEYEKDRHYFYQPTN